MLDPKDVMMNLEEEACVSFEEEYGREPNKEELAKIQQDAFDGIGDYYAGVGDFIRDMAKEK